MVNVGPLDDEFEQFDRFFTSVEDAKAAAQAQLAEGRAFTVRKTAGGFVVDADTIPVFAGAANPPWLAAAKRKEREYADKVRAQKEAEERIKEKFAEVNDSLQAQYTAFGRVQSMLAATTMFPYAYEGEAPWVWDWCWRCDRVVMNHFMWWPTPDDYCCWQCSKGIAVPAVELPAL